MSFKRSLQREKKVELVKEKPKKETFQDNFTFRWIPFSFQSFLILGVIFAFTQFLCIPFIANYCSYPISLVAVHALLSSLLVVMGFYFYNHEDLSLKSLWTRYYFCAFMFGGLALSIALFMKG